MPLTELAIRHSKGGITPKGEPTDKPYKMADSGGLYLEVAPSGGKWWRIKYRFGGKEKRISLGVYPDVSLKEARDRRDDARKLLAKGIDPGEQRKTTKAKQAAAAANSFEAVARLWHTTVTANLVPVYASKIIRSLEMDVFPTLGNRPIGDIKPVEVLAMLKKIEARGSLETLKRVRQRCADVFTYAINHGLREAENPVIGLEKALRTAKPKHYAALHVRQLHEFFIRLNAARISLPVKLAVHLAVLLFLRPGELRSAHWKEIDLDSAVWIVPGDRDRERGMTGMKMKETHVVPLSQQAIEIFQQLLPYSGAGDLVFPNRNDHSRPISNGKSRPRLFGQNFHGDKWSPAGVALSTVAAAEGPLRP